MRRNTAAIAIAILVFIIACRKSPGAQEPPPPSRATGTIAEPSSIPASSIPEGEAPAGLGDVILPDDRPGVDRMFARLPLEIMGQRRDWLPGPPEVFGVAYGFSDARAGGKHLVVHVRVVPLGSTAAEVILDVLSEGLDHETRRDGDLVWMTWEIKGAVGMWWATINGHWIFGASAPVDEFHMLLDHVIAALDQ